MRYVVECRCRCGCQMVFDTRTFRGQHHCPLCTEKCHKEEVEDRTGLSVQLKYNQAGKRVMVWLYNRPGQQETLKFIKEKYKGDQSHGYESIDRPFDTGRRDRERHTYGDTGAGNNLRGRR